MDKELEDKLNLIIENQQCIYALLRKILSRIEESDDKAFTKNYLADVAGTVTAELGLADLVRGIKK